MPVFALQPAFSRGEISPRLWARADISHYALALKECTNFTVMRQGGLTRRTGTQFINEVKNSSQRVRLIDFVFSTQQAYVLEFGHLYMRVYASGGIVTSGGTPVEIATPYTQDQIFDLQYVQSADVLYIAHPSHFPRKVTRTSHTSWSIAEVAFKDGPFGDMNPGVSLDEVQLVQNPDFNTGGENWEVIISDDDVMIDYDSSQKAMIFHLINGESGNGILRQAVATDGPGETHVIHIRVVGVSDKLHFQIGTTDSTDDIVSNRSLDAGWHTFSFTPGVSTFYVQFLGIEGTTGIQAGVAGVYCYRQDAHLLSPSGLFGTVTVTALGHAPFVASDVGRAIRIEHMGRSGGWGIITEVNSASSVTVQVRKRFASSAPTEQWRLGAFSVASGYPGRVAFYQERLAFARTAEKPQTIWFSKTAQLEDYGTSVPLLDDDALQFTILSESVNEIQWIKEGSDLIIGTTAGIRSLGPADNANAFSHSNVLQKRHVNYGAAARQPIEVGQVTLYLDRFRKGVREAMYSFENDQIVAPEVTVLSEHVFARGVADMAYQASPISVLWLALDTGELAGITYEREQEMFATHVHRLGGSFGNDAFGHVESVATIPGQDGDELWLIVKRTINGQTRRYVERLSGVFDGDLRTAFFVDSGLSYRGAPANVFSGLDHLEGQEVAILGDGAVFPSRTVIGGTVSLQDGEKVSNASIGLAYHSQIHTLDPGVSRGDGSGLGRRKKITKIMVDLYETGQLMGRTAGSAKAETIVLRSTSDLMDEPVPLTSGWKTFRPDGGWGDSPGEVVLFVDLPVPATIRSVTPVIEPEP